MIALGAVLIFATFIAIVTANNYITATYDSTTATVLRAATGVANGSMIFILSIIYKHACTKVVDHENHKFDSTYENSYIFKRVIFDFVFSYINLFYYAFYHQEFRLLADNYIFMIITKNLLFAFKVS